LRLLKKLIFRHRRIEFFQFHLETGKEKNPENPVQLKKGEEW